MRHSRNLSAQIIFSNWRKTQICLEGLGTGLVMEGIGTGLVNIYVWIAPFSPCVCGRNQFTNTKFTRPKSQISKSRHTRVLNWSRWLRKSTLPHVVFLAPPMTTKTSRARSRLKRKNGVKVQGAILGWMHLSTHFSLGFRSHLPAATAYS